MIYSKTSPVGLDRVIQNIQARIYEDLQSVFNLSESDILSYGRVYKIEKEDGYTLRWYSSSNDYQEHDMLLDDKYKVQFYFIDTDIRSYTSLVNTDVEIYFFVNLTSVKPTIAHMADEEVKQDIFNILCKYEGLNSIERITNLPGYSPSMDMHPYHSFKAKIQIRYGYEKTI